MKRDLHLDVDYLELPVKLGDIDTEIKAVLEFYFHAAERGTYATPPYPANAEIKSVKIGETDILPRLSREDVKALEEDIIWRAE